MEEICLLTPWSPVWAECWPCLSLLPRDLERGIWSSVNLGKEALMVIRT